MQDAVEPADWTKLEVPRLEVEVGDEVVDAAARSAAGDGRRRSRPSRAGRRSRATSPSSTSIAEDGPGQRDYVVELGAGPGSSTSSRQGIRDLAAGESREVGWELADGTTRSVERDAEGALREGAAAARRRAWRARPRSSTRSTSCAPTSRSGSATLLEEEAESRFRADAVDELVKATDVRPGRLVVEVRTRELLNAFLRQLESRGIDPAAYLQADRHQRRRARAAAAGRGGPVDRARARARGRRRQARDRGHRRRHPRRPPRGAARATRTSRSSSPPAAPTASATTCA